MYVHHKADKIGPLAACGQQQRITLPVKGPPHDSASNVAACKQSQKSRRFWKQSNVMHFLHPKGNATDVSDKLENDSCQVLTAKPFSFSQAWTCNKYWMWTEGAVTPPPNTFSYHAANEVQTEQPSAPLLKTTV